MKQLYSLLLFLMLALNAGAAAQDAITITPEVIDTAGVIANGRNFNPDFKQKYKGPDFVYERNKVEEKPSKWDEFLRWLDYIFSSEDDSKGESVPLSVIIIRVVAGVIVLLVIYFIVMAVLKKDGYWIFGRAKKSISARDLNIENIDTTDFQSLINTTLQAGDHRLGIRYYYLWLLKLLAHNNIIKWHKDKTNGDYLYEIKDEALREQFRYLSYIYDYSWYGEFPVSSDNFARAEKAFSETINRLKQ
ncbi:MAG: DUF4129 domain-containing protein [Flavobacterium sp.]